MNLTHPRIAVAAAFLVATETLLLLFIARSAAPAESVPVIHAYDVPDHLDALAARSRQGDANATFEYARRIELGLGTRKDAALAAYWYQVAEEQGYELPQEVIDRMFP